MGPIPGNIDHSPSTMVDAVGTINEPELPQMPTVVTDSFIENKGQSGDGSGFFYVSGFPVSVAFGPGWVSYYHQSADEESMSTLYRVSFIGSEVVEPKGSGPLGFKTNFFIGDVKEDWVTGVDRFEEIVYQDIWGSIDLRFMIVEGTLKYEFHVPPGISPDVILLHFEGVDNLEVEAATGDLSIQTSVGIVIDEAPVSYQMAPLGRQIIDSSFHITGEDVLSFLIDGYDPRYPIVIDPGINFSTYMGSGGFDHVHDTHIDDDGYIYVTGHVRQGSFPTTPGAYDRTYNSSEGFIFKMTPDGERLVFSTYIGGSRTDRSRGIHVDDSGAVYVVGWSVSSDFPVTSGAFQSSGLSWCNGFLAKLDKTGSKLLYGTYLDNNGYDVAERVTLDDEGLVYITGYTNGTGNLTTSDAYDTVADDDDAFIIVLNITSSTLVHGSLFGGTYIDFGIDIDLDPQGRICIIGRTWSSDFPVKNAYRNRPYHRTGQDAFILKYNHSSSSLVYSTYFGADHYDTPRNLYVDSNGSAYVAGDTYYDYSFPKTPGVYGTDPTLSYDAFLFKLSNDGTKLIISTLIGGKANDYCAGMYVDDSGDIYLTGQTSSSDFPTTDDAADRTHNGDYDVFVLRLNWNATELKSSTMIGGTDEDIGVALRALGNGNITVVGTTKSHDFPNSTTAYDTSYNDEEDIFVLKLSEGHMPEILNDLTTNVTTTGAQLDFALLVKDNLGILNGCVEWWYDSGVHWYENLINSGGTFRNGTWSASITTWLDTLTNISYKFHINDTSGNRIFTPLTNITVLDNLDPFLVDRNTWMATTGETFDFEVAVFDYIGIENVSVTYWFGNRTGREVNTTMEMVGNLTDEWVLYRLSGLPILSWQTEDLNLFYSAKDSSGNWNSTAVFPVEIVDNDRPLILNDTSDEEAGTGSSIRMRVEVEDNIGIDRVNVTYWFNHDEVNAVTVVMAPSNITLGGNGTYSQDQVKIPIGYIRFFHYRFTVYDKSENDNKTSTKRIDIFDTSPPFILSDKSQMRVTTGQDFRFEVEVYDNYGIDRVWVVYWFGDDDSAQSNETMVERIAPGDGPKDYYHDRLTVPNDSVLPINYYFVTMDITGLINQTEVKMVKVIDSLPPIIHEVNIIGEPTTGESISISVEVSDNIGIARTYLHMWMMTSPDIILNLTMDEGTSTHTGNRVFEYLGLAIAEDNIAPYSWMVVVLDASGNRVVSEVYDMEPWDNDPPIFLTDDSSEEAVKGWVFEFRSVVKDNMGIDSVHVSYIVDDGSPINLTMKKESGEGTEISALYSILLPREMEGSLTYWFTTVDTQGLWNATQGRTVTVINHPPALTSDLIWEVTEQEAPSVLDLEPSITDLNDDMDRMIVYCYSPDIRVSGLTLEARFREWREEYTILVTLDDGEDETVWNITIQVINVNDPPILTLVQFGGELFDPLSDIISLSEDDNRTLYAEAIDEDGDDLTFKWIRDGEVVATGQEVGFGDLPIGDYKLKLVVSDGSDKVEYLLSVNIIEPKSDDKITDTNWFVPIILIIVVAAVLGTSVVILRRKS